MLNSVEWLTNRILERPSCAWWNGDLWVAHLDLNEQVTVTRTSVQSSPVSASSTGLGFRSSLGPAIAPLRADKLIVAIAAPGQPIRLLASSDGTTFGAPIDLPFVSVMPPALAVADKLWLAWVDEDFGLHLAHSSDAVNFDDEPTPVRVGRPAAIAGLTDPVEDSAIALAWRELHSHAIVLTSFRESDFDPALPERVSLPDTDVDHVAVAFAIGHAAAEGRIVVGCEHFEPPQATSADHRIFARQVSRDLAHVCGPEPMPHPGLGPGFARGGGRVWGSVAATWLHVPTTWSSLPTTSHSVCHPSSRLSSVNLAIRNYARPTADSPANPPDLRLVCVATDEFEWRRFEPGWIQNARKGDLVITPASGAGIIGGFLKELAFEQRYDHMGIMVDDHRTVRHTTMAHARLKNFYIGSVFGEPAPADGIRPDVVKYGWPGTITQTVQNGFFDGFNDGANPEWVDATAPPPPPEPSGENATDEQKKEYREAVQRFRGFVDPEFVKDGKRVGYAFANLTRSAQFRLDGTVVEPLVVKPPPAVEASDPLVRPTLHRVAEAARTIRGHYRFYGYTEGSIAEMPAMVGPPVGDVTWQNLPAGASWAAGTPALVCSTFIWAAVREASRKRYPNLRLDDRSQTTAEDTWRAPPTPRYCRWPLSLPPGRAAQRGPGALRPRRRRRSIRGLGEYHEAQGQHRLARGRRSSGPHQPACHPRDGNPGLDKLARHPARERPRGRSRAQRHAGRRRQRDLQHICLGPTTQEGRSPLGNDRRGPQRRPARHHPSLGFAEHAQRPLACRPVGPPRAADPA